MLYLSVNTDLFTRNIQPEFKEQTDPLKEKLRALVNTDYMDIVFSLCAVYERQGYLEGIKVGARLMMED